MASGTSMSTAWLPKGSVCDGMASRRPTRARSWPTSALERTWLHTNDCTGEFSETHSRLGNLQSDFQTVRLSQEKKSEKNQDANASRAQPTNCCQDGALRQIGVARVCLIPSRTRLRREHCDQPLWATSCPSLEQPSFQLESEKEAPLVSVRDLEVEPQQ